VTTYLTWPVYKDGQRRDDPPDAIAEFEPVNARRPSDAARMAALIVSTRDYPHMVDVGVIRADRIRCSDHRVQRYEIVFSRGIRKIARTT
jgi:hypothetical protein